MIIENVDEATFVMVADSLEGIDSLSVVDLAAHTDEEIEFFQVIDAQGKVTNWSDIGVITGFGFTVVFLVIAMLIVVFTNLPKLLNFQIKKKLKREGKLAEGAVVPVSGEVNAAIATSLMIFLNEQHDEESNVITIKRVARVYSPWSSKIYGLNNYFRS